ncbi:hypothetical protein pb186bvf_010811 [Paramecium bursaria]
MIFIIFVYAQNASFSSLSWNLTDLYYKNYEQLLPEYILDINGTSMTTKTCITCLDYPIMTQGPDFLLTITYSYGFTVQCQLLWELKQVCGTFIEIHKYLNKEILQQIQLQDFSLQNLGIYISTKDLLPGRYEIWLVFRSRIGSIIVGLKSFYLII